MLSERFFLIIPLNTQFDENVLDSSLANLCVNFDD